MSIIEAKNLNLYYGTNRALKDINIEFEKNEVTALIGPSGCGKSTFLRTINRMNDLIDSVKIEGDIFFEGNNIFKDCDEITLRKRIGMVFQKPNPFPMSIYDNVAYGPRIHGIKDKKILDEIVEKSLRGAAEEMFDVWLGFRHEQLKSWYKDAGFIDIDVKSTGLKARGESSKGEIIEPKIFLAKARK